MLLAVAPAASPGVKSAAVLVMAVGSAAALQSAVQSTDVATTVHTEEEMLPRQAFYAMAYMVRTSCSAGAGIATSLQAQWQAGSLAMASGATGVASLVINAAEAATKSGLATVPRAKA